jgi:hypothetical protein
VGTPDRGGVGVHGVRRQIEDIAVATAGQHHRVREVAGDLPSDQVPGDDPAGLVVNDDQIEHLGARVHLDLARRDLPGQRLVGAEQQLLTGLSAGIEGARDLHTAEGAGVEESAVLAGEGHPLGDALVDDLA